MEHYIGLMSGTSMDGVDAVISSFDERAATLVCSHKFDYPDELRDRLRAATARPDAVGTDAFGELDTWTGECFRDAALALLAKSGLDRATITAIGSHGQTLRHQPDAPHPFTIQIGNPAIIASATGIPTVADFRRADVALGGQGAPLVPPFHRWLLHDDGEDRIVLNVGGIANLTVLPASGKHTSGFDTGPGNTLLDAWIFKHRGARYDDRGSWAAGGTVIDTVLQQQLADPWFDKPPPKSTGVEYFNLDWLNAFGVDDHSPRDIQATLAELTAASIVRAIDAWAPATRSVYQCGGGVHNLDLASRLRERLRPRTFLSTEAAGLDPDWVEAQAFAWLAMRRLKHLPGNLPAVTGASRDAVLGAIYSP